MHRNRRLVTGIKCICENARKAMSGLIKKPRNLHLPLHCILTAFDTLVVPILLYGSEVWGFENLLNVFI